MTRAAPAFPTGTPSLDTTLLMEPTSSPDIVGTDITRFMMQ